MALACLVWQSLLHLNTTTGCVLFERRQYVSSGNQLRAVGFISVFLRFPANRDNQTHFPFDYSIFHNFLCRVSCTDEARLLAWLQDKTW